MKWSHVNMTCTQKFAYISSSFLETQRDYICGWPGSIPGNTWSFKYYKHRFRDPWTPWSTVLGVSEHCRGSLGNPKYCKQLPQALALLNWQPVVHSHPHSPKNLPGPSGSMIHTSRNASRIFSYQSSPSFILWLISNRDSSEENKTMKIHLPSSKIQQFLTILCYQVYWSLLNWMFESYRYASTFLRNTSPRAP